MKKKILLVGLLGIAPFAAMAAPNNVGCGLGSMVFNGQSGLAPQVMAATTNGSFGNQTFGITSGTIGCARDGVVQNPVKVSMFIDTNLDKLARDMSVGSGEALDSLAALIGVQEADKATFYQTAKENLAVIIPSEKATTAEVMSGLNQILAGNEQLAKYATLI